MSVSLLVALNGAVAAVYAPPGDVDLPDYDEPIVVDWGDGSAPAPFLLGVPGAQAVQPGYAAPGDYTIRATGRLTSGARFSQALTVTIPAAAALDLPMVDEAIAGELPADGPATLAGAKRQGNISAANDAELQDIVDAVNDQVRSWPTAERSRGLAAWWRPTVRGANMLAVRLWRRKDTPGGVEVYGDFGIAYVRRLDPDVAQLLELGDWSRPGLG